MRVPVGYPHAFETLVIVVENKMSTTATALQRVIYSPILYFWLLFIVTFVVIRCGLQWLNTSGADSPASKRQRCVFMCEDTVQLSCGIVMNSELFVGRRYRHALLGHGATIIPFIAGMFISGLLYGDYVIKSEGPSIDTIEQLEQSDLIVYASLLNISENFVG